MWNELYWQTVSPLFVALSEIFLSAEEFSSLSVSTTLESLHLVYFEELVVRGNDSWTVEEWNKTVRGQNIVFETSCPFNNWPSNHISHLLFNFLQRKTYCLSFLMASTSWKTLTQACHENLWLGFLVVVSLLFEDGLQVYDVKTITLPMPWRWCCLAWPLGNREHKQVNTSKWTQVNTSSMASWKAWNKQLLHQNLRALASPHLQQTINPTFLLFLSIITSYIEHCPQRTKAEQTEPGKSHRVAARC